MDDRKVAQAKSAIAALENKIKSTANEQLKTRFTQHIQYWKKVIEVNSAPSSNPVPANVTKPKEVVKASSK